MHIAYNELQRIRKLVAFNIQGPTTRRKLNQHCKRYTFPDGSILQLYNSGRGQTWPSKTSNCDCVSMIRANKSA